MTQTETVRGRETTVSRPRVSHRWFTIATCILLVILMFASVMIGVSDLTLGEVLSGSITADQWHLIMISRVPRTLAAVLSGACIAVAGAVMQLTVRNRFVSPTTAGTTQFAVAGLLIVALFWPGAPVITKMIISSLCAIIGTFAFLMVLRALPRRRTQNDVSVPLVGIMLGGIVEAVTTFVAWREDLLQSLGSWTVGDLSTVLAGRYELLWIVAALTVLLYLGADRLTVAGLGRETAIGLGLNYERTVGLALGAESITTAVSVVVVGQLPFLGLVVPNIASRLIGDNLRHCLPWIALSGACLTLLCDITGRLVRYPYEVSLSVVMGVIGAAGFLIILLRSVDRG